MEDCNPVSTPMEPGTKLSKFDGGERADSGRYRSLIGSLRYLTSTRPDLMLSVGITSRFMEDPSYTHWKALKRILRFVRGTLSLGLFYSKSDDYQLVGYSDNDWCGDVDDRKSTSVWLSNLLRHMRVIRDERIMIRVDNKSAIELAKKPVKHRRSKYIDV
uniref:Retrovirus-related Pol polyprotein from transposon TNT 1-94 n=1 Tax=Cajanus cajan TaxID=3821 RepID=A0A151TTW0_CAJCA|nr:Retrovirus-related Pol polyprotein from transposon TNT 1-94 [Cajanus cajan]